MQKLQLYIDNQRIELFKDESVSLTQTIQNVRDISKIFTDFSKSFTIPASKTNNKIFKHYYNFDIVGGFDGRKKVDAEIQLNSVTFKKGKVKLEGVQLKRNKAYSYKITFFGNTVTLKDLLGEDKLVSLTSLNSYNYVYNSANNLTKLQADPSSTDFVIPMISHTDRWYIDGSGGSITGLQNLKSSIGSPAEGVYWNMIKPALRVSEVIGAIESKYGLTFSTDFFTSSNTNYNDLFLWLHRKKGVPKPTGENVERLVSEFTAQAKHIPTETEMIDTHTLRFTGSRFNLNQFNITLTRLGTNPIDVVIYKDGLEYYRKPNITSTSVTIDGLSDFILFTGDYEIYLEAQSANLPISVTSLSYDIENTSAVAKNYSSSPFTFQDEFQFILTQQLPDIKVIDFLSGLFKMFNLTAYVEDDGTIKVQTLDSFYATGTDYDITEFVDVESSQVDVALPYRQIDFRYQDTDYLFSKDHNERFAQEWGKEEYDSNGEQDLDGSIYKVELPFTHMKYERLVDQNTSTTTDVMWGYAVNESEEPRLGKPLLTYIIRQTSATSINYVDGTSTENSITTYNIPSNSVSLSSSTDKSNLNFKNELNEYDATADFTDTLFQEYYSTYIADVFNERNRITKVTAYLPLRILLNYSLADIFIIRGNRYKINSIKTNLTTGKSDIELLNDL